MTMEDSQCGEMLIGNLLIETTAQSDYGKTHHFVLGLINSQHEPISDIYANRRRRLTYRKIEHISFLVVIPTEIRGLFEYL